MATGATWGKRNIEWVEGEAVSVRVTNTKTGKAAEVKPTKKLTELLTSFQPRPKVAAAGSGGQEKEDDHDVLEKIAREIARLPEAEILTVRVRE